MGHPFFEPSAKQRSSEAIQAVERASSAEVVISVRFRSGTYREADFLFGFVVSLAVLCALLFLPQPFAVEWMPVDLVFAFVLGSVVSAYVWPIKRLFSASKARAAHVRRAAQAAFVNQGISKTRRRTGLLVYVSAFERCVELVPDIGISRLSELPAYGDAYAALARSVEAHSMDGFVTAIQAFAPLLAEVAPPTDDDNNELPDEVDAA